VSEQAIMIELHQRLGIDLQAPAADQFIILLDELYKWNRRINLTAIHDRQEAIEKHLLDSMTVSCLLTGSERLLDMGSGGGFPGLPLKIALSGLTVVSVDSVWKKISFQRHMARMLSLHGFQALPQRAEDLPRQPGFSGSFDVVVSRAFSSLERFVLLARPLLAAGGRIVAMKGDEGEREWKEARSALARQGLKGKLHPFILPWSGSARFLIVMQSVDSE
jgi:16S rRNA (guanine527-N7)-methyltransferase